ncbi:MAG: AAA family ATPase [Succinivibrionaceae bacterium]|nr:AAA family ATPase [Succinivibrionaceae bacterium]
MIESEMLQKAVSRAEELAEVRFGSSIVSLDHLLYALIETDEEVSAFLMKEGYAPNSVMDVISDHILSDSPRSVGGRKPTVSPTFKRVLERAVFVAQYSNRTQIYGLDVLDAMFPERDSFVSLLLTQSLDIARASVRKYCQRLHGKTAESGAAPAGGEAPASAESSAIPEGLENCLTNLNDMVMKGKVEQLVGREDDLARIYEVLGRKKKNNVLIVGEPGVGKTALAEGVAWNIVHKKVPEFLKDFTVYALDTVGVISGTQFRGDYEKRLKAVVAFIQEKDTNILFIDDVQQLFSTNSSDAATGASMIQSDLLRGNLHCIAATTFKDYNKIFSRDAGFARRFHKLDLTPPTEDETFEILSRSREQYEKFHGVSYPDAVLRKTIQLSEKYMYNRFLPDKVFDVIDDIGSFFRISRPAGSHDVHIVSAEDVARAFTRILKIPVDLKEDDTAVYRDLRKNLLKRIFGQDEAVSAVVDAVIMNRSGLDNATRPIGSFLFAGPTGVGKTEIVLQLASLLNMKLIRLDMSEYSSEFTVSKLLGSPPGYVGYNEGGILTNQVKNAPRSVVLFDELEKAHPSIYNVLLQIMDNGMITDAIGVTVNFRNTIVVMTTNCGASEIERGSIGFTAGSSSFDSTSAIRQAFSPEFRNRLDAVVWFKNLSPEVVDMVFDKLWQELMTQLKEKNVEAEISDEARRELVRRGYDRSMGARPMRRTIRNLVHKELAREILFGSLLYGGRVSIGYDGRDFTFDYVSNPAPEPEDMSVDAVSAGAEAREEAPEKTEGEIREELRVATPSDPSSDGDASVSI